MRLTCYGLLRDVGSRYFSVLLEHKCNASVRPLQVIDEQTWQGEDASGHSSGNADKTGWLGAGFAPP